MSHKTALVTGASEGIGLEFCKLLAARGYHLILVSRPQALLQEIAQQLEGRHPGIRCTVIAADLAQPQAAETLFNKVKAQQLQVDFLINNAGLLQNGFFVKLSLAKQEAMMQVNVVALTCLTHLFANDMASRKSGHILNLASTAAWMPIPNENVYAATKAFVLSFTQALADEMAALNSGVTISALCPGYTATKMMDNPDQGATLKISSDMMMAPAVVAEIGLNGCLAGKVTIVPGLSNKFVTLLSHLLPKMTFAKILGAFYRKNLVQTATTDF